MQYCHCKFIKLFLIKYNVNFLFYLDCELFVLYVYCTYFFKIEKGFTESIIMYKTSSKNGSYIKKNPLNLTRKPPAKTLTLFNLPRQRP